VTYRFHVLGIPHTATSKDYCCCAFTQKVLNLCAILSRRGHTVFHYGNEESRVEATEHVSVTSISDITAPEFSGAFDVSGPTYAKFYERSIAEIERRKESRDFLLCMWGSGHKPVADAHADLIVVEPGIGYPGGHFANFKVFESYAILHAYAGLEAVAQGDKVSWYSAVIPNAYDLRDFSLNPCKGDYLFFLGRRLLDGGSGKGIDIAVEVAAAAGRQLIVAGPGPTRTFPTHVKPIGVVDFEARRHWLSRAAALLAPSRFVEPFCGAAVEALLCGTPVISSDWGAFAENNIHGVTGYRCRTFEQFKWAASKGIEEINPQDCRKFAEANFSLERVSEQYQEYFDMVMDIYRGKGWYEPKLDRQNLNWLKREYVC
jgi:glycosyltransferase involved in cell wall biosynthesis